MFKVAQARYRVTARFWRARRIGMEPSAVPVIPGKYAHPAAIAQGFLLRKDVTRRVPMQWAEKYTQHCIGAFVLF